MRLQLGFVVALIAGGCSPYAPPPDPEAESGPRFITLDSDALETAQAAIQERNPGAQLNVVANRNGVAVLEFDAADYRSLSIAMHENHSRCGGFMEHESLTEALDATAPLPAMRLANLVTYTIDNAATVTPVLAGLNQAQLLTTIQSLVGFQTRFYTSTGGANAAVWLRDLWQGYATAAGRTEITAELFETGFPQKSVIVTIPGETLPNEVVVVGGHLDSIVSGSNFAPGADDDASGIATLSEVYRTLIASNYRPARTVKFMAYAAEEVGLRGSRQIAQQYAATGVNVIGVMQLDMTNFQGSERDVYLFQDFTNAAQNTFIGSLIDTYLGLTWGTDSCGYACSDHASWHQAGFVASMPFESRMSQHNPTIHTESDTLSMSGNNANHAFKFARVAATYVVELAKGQIGGIVNQAPVVTITAPVAGQTFPSTATISLVGTATDAEDGTLSGSIQWTSSLDGALGTGATRLVTLSQGSHLITALVSDSEGLTSSAAVAITVTGPTADLLNENFETGNNWTPTGLWHVVTNSACATPGYSSAIKSMYFGRDAGCNYATGTRATGTITSQTINNVSATSTLRFQYFRRVEAAPGGYDAATVEIVRGTTTTTIWTRASDHASNALWNDSGAISLAAFAGQPIQLRFRFDSRDSQFNTFTGWLVDDIVVTR